MKTVRMALMTLCLLTMRPIANAQNQFTSCSAAFLDNKMVVNQYSPEGKCMLPIGATGKLIVAETTLFEDGKANITNKIEFMVAIRDHNTKTLMMLSSEVYREINIEKIMTQCHKGDHIVLLTLKDKYALPHNEILVQ